MHGRLINYTQHTEYEKYPLICDRLQDNLLDQKYAEHDVHYTKPQVKTLCILLSIYNGMV